MLRPSDMPMHATNIVFTRAFAVDHACVWTSKAYGTRRLGSGST